MRVIISAGGTGGHIYPALAIVNKIKEMEPNSEFLYIGTHNRMEKDIVPKYGIPFKTIEIYGFSKSISGNFKAIKKFVSAYKKSKEIIKEFKPDIVIGVGGYVTGPVLYAASKLGIKTFIHEQNSIPGKCNKFLSRYVDLIGVSMKSSLSAFPKEKTKFTGNPCSEEAVKIEPALKSEFGLTNSKKLVYIVMGSLGSSKITEKLKNSIELFKNKNYEVMFVTGKDSYDDIKNIDIPKNVKIFPYVESQSRIMKKADLVITRCGASTLAEIISLKLPSILIPSPYVPNNHQFINGMDLVKCDAGIMIEEKDLTGENLVGTIDKIIFDDKKLEKMRENLKKLGIEDSATKIYDLISKLVSGE
ncbi:MAG: undecaprenyldiphospho-muramoylpentapeptide beta-N-acetylglucosaminyltransferase [Bacilli bacterium]|nr:undecaprenyldiphospho-muramoylpentapeptide beta-N-acetylglucosaminyltransferase [Bacilli bacterium]